MAAVPGVAAVTDTADGLPLPAPRQPGQEGLDQQRGQQEPQTDGGVQGLGVGPVAIQSTLMSTDYSNSSMCCLLVTGPSTRMTVVQSAVT